MNKKTIVATEMEGLSIRALTITVEVLDERIDLISTIKEAATAYFKTEEGQSTYESNSEQFNWGDLGDMPDSFCKQYGFKIIDIGPSDFNVDWNEQLVEG